MLISVAGSFTEFLPYTQAYLTRDQCCALDWANDHTRFLPPHSVLDRYLITDSPKGKLGTNHLFPAIVFALYCILPLARPSRWGWGCCCGRASTASCVCPRCPSPLRDTPPPPTNPSFSSPFSSFLAKIKIKMDTTPPSPSSPHLEWSNVGFGFAFIAINVVLSQALHLQIGTSLVISAVRCTVQLAFVATILQRVFAAHTIWTVAAIARTSHTHFHFYSRGSRTATPVLLNMLGTLEAGAFLSLPAEYRFDLT